MQLELFPTRPEPTKKSTTKKSPTLDLMTRDERAAMIKALARLMMKVIRPETKGGSDE